MSEEQSNRRPRYQLSTNYGLAKYIIFGCLTVGIYPLVIHCHMVNDLNAVASPRDGRHTVHYLGALLIGSVTLCIYLIVWFHQYSNRLGEELKNRGVAYDFSAATYWLWDVLGALIFVGPFIYLYKLCHATNLMNENYNING